MWARTCGGQPLACDAVVTSSNVSANVKGCFQCKNELANGLTDLKMLGFLSWFYCFPCRYALLSKATFCPVEVAENEGMIWL